MIKTNDSETRKLLDAVGAEPLAGSGFEDEISESDFADAEDE